MPNVYKVGDSPVPKWCRRILTPYKKMNGSVGFEFYGTNRTLELSHGDEIKNNNGKLEVIRSKEDGY